jgi:hypothetical protein
MSFERERSHGAEVATRATNGPKKVRLCGLAAYNDVAVGENHLSFDEVVYRKTVLGCEPTVSTAEGETPNTCI